MIAGRFPLHWLRVERPSRIGKLAVAFLLGGIFFLVLPGGLQAEENIPGTAVGAEAAEPKVDFREALRALVSQIRDLDESIASTEAAIQSIQSSDLRAIRLAELRGLRERRAEARLDLLDIISDVDLSGFQPVEEQTFTLQGAIEDLVRPLIDEVRKATAGSRERRDLEERFDLTRQRTHILETALVSLDEALSSAQDPEVRAVLTSVRAEFQDRYENSRNSLTVLEFRLAEIESQSLSLVDETTGILTSFFRERGRNLFLAILAAVVVAIGVRVLSGYLHNHTKVFKKGRSQAARLLDVSLYALTFLGAVVAVIVVFLIAGDWVLLGLVVLILLAIAFAARDALPGYMDEIRLMLNMGAVRENERIVFDGVPWVVENLTFFTTLRNPVLRGGMIRMPIAQLIGMLSRPATENEPFFPCEEGDWVLLNDDTYGEVVFQSVEMVCLQLRGGAKKTYPTSEFLETNPQNHSQGFRIRTTIGIDYKYQEKCTGEILENLNVFYREAVEALVEKSKIRSLKVEFTSANASSLDYKVLLDLDGSLAQKHNPISRALQRIGVDACNKFGLEIPFQQLTVHHPSPVAHRPSDE